MAVSGSLASLISSESVGAGECRGTCLFAKSPERKFAMWLEKDSVAEREGFEPSIELFNPITV